MTTNAGQDGLSLRGYLHVVGRWKWLIAGVTLLVALAGTAYVWTRTPLYAASSDMVYVKQLDISDPLGQSYIDTTAQQAEIESVPTVIQSATVHDSARQKMKKSTIAAGYAVSATLTSGSNNNYSNIVGIKAVSPDPAAAADAANAYAEAYVEWNRDSTRSQVTDAITVVQERLKTFTTSTQRQSDEYKALQSRLEDLELLEASSSSSFRIITQASTPAAPFSPQKARGLALAIIGGLVLGLCLAFLIEQFDTRVRGEEQVRELLDLPIVGHVPPPSRKAREKGVLQTVADPTGPAAEAYRLLRNNLDFTGVDADIDILLISSSIQGEGKSVLACNLATSMALTGKRVVLVDADLRSPRVHTYVGVPNSRGVSTVVARRDPLEEALVPVSLAAVPLQNGSVVMTTQVGGKAAGRGAAKSLRGSPSSAAADPTVAAWISPDGGGEAPNLRVLPSGPLPPNPGEIVASNRFGELLAELARDADLVLVDAPAMLPVGDTAALAPWADAMVYVVNYEMLKRANLEQAKAQLAHLPCRKLGLVIVSAKRGHGYYGYYSRPSGNGGRLGSRSRASVRTGGI